MSEFTPGDIVDITIKGARVHAWRPEVSELTVESKADANSDLTTYDYASAQVEVERVAPAEWPPRPGDVWLDAEGRAWTALRGRMFPVTSTHGESADAALATYGPLTLVHREDEQDGGGSDG